MFVGILGGFVVLRGAGSGDSSGTTGGLPPLFLVATAVIIGSSLSLAVATLARSRGRPKLARRCWELSLFAALGFGALQVLAGVRWWQEGSLPSTHNWRGAVYLLAGLHALHVAAGAAWLLRERCRWDRSTSIGSAAAFWHFVGIVWIVVYAFLAQGPW